MPSPDQAERYQVAFFLNLDAGKKFGDWTGANINQLIPDTNLLR